MRLLRRSLACLSTDVCAHRTSRRHNPQYQSRGDLTRPSLTHNMAAAHPDVTDAVSRSLLHPLHTKPSQIPSIACLHLPPIRPIRPVRLTGLSSGGSSSLKRPPRRWDPSLPGETRRHVDPPTQDFKSARESRVSRKKSRAGDDPPRRSSLCLAASTVGWIRPPSRPPPPTAEWVRKLRGDVSAALKHKRLCFFDVSTASVGGPHPSHGARSSSARRSAARRRATRSPHSRVIREDVRTYR